ncbi:universal stress protein [Haliangium sp.]|uniref:universal stress protein n=1 Tax=Haliangium sp. TaxID=2663208 RepID=UPI003D0E3240
MDIKKIVVGIDFSDEARAATRQALNIARHTGAEVVLVHVGTVLDSPRHEGGVMHSTIKEWEELVREQLAEDRRELDEMRQRMHGQGVEITHLVRDGFADTGLTEAAEELGADLLIVGTHGRSGLRRFFLGSISERVVRLANTSVMVARPKSEGSGGYGRILVPTDFSRPSEKAVQMALALAARGARIDVVHFWQIPVTATTPYAPFKAAEEALTTVRRAMAESAESAGERMVERYEREGIEISFHAIEAAPAYGIQERLEEIPYDIVVMGSHGRRGLRRFLLGSVAELTVRHTDCSVVVVHGHGDDVASDAASDAASDD